MEQWVLFVRREEEREREREECMCGTKEMGNKKQRKSGESKRKKHGGDRKARVVSSISQFIFSLLGVVWKDSFFFFSLSLFLFLFRFVFFFSIP